MVTLGGSDFEKLLAAALRCELLMYGDMSNRSGAGGGTVTDGKGASLRFDAGSSGNADLARGSRSGMRVEGGGGAQLRVRSSIHDVALLPLAACPSRASDSL